MKKRKKIIRVLLILLIFLNAIAVVIGVFIGLRFPKVKYTIDIIPEKAPVTFRGALVDDDWIEPQSICEDVEGWEYGEDGSIRSYDNQKLTFLLEGRKIVLVFNTGYNEGIVNVVVDGNSTKYSLEDYGYSDVGTPFQIARFDIQGLDEAFFHVLPIIVLAEILLIFFFVVLLAKIDGLFQQSSGRADRNGTIEALRIFCCISVIFHHFLGYSKTGYLGVDVFFMISGYFLMKTYRTNFKTKEENFIDAWRYTYTRWKRLIPEYFCSFCLSLVIFATLGTSFPLSKLLTDWIWELLFVKNVGIQGWSNVLVIPPGWFCSSLIIAGFFVYICLIKNEKYFISFLVPACVLLFFPWVANQYGNINCHSQYGLFTATGTIRAFVELGLGCIIYYIVIEYVNPHKIRRSIKRYIGLIEVCILFFCGYKVWRGSPSLSDFAFVIAMAMVLIIIFSDYDILRKMFSNRLVYMGGKISMCMYLNHIILTKIEWNYLFSKAEDYYWLIYLLIVIVCSITEYYFVLALKKYWDKRRRMRVCN